MGGAGGGWVGAGGGLQVGGWRRVSRVGGPLGAGRPTSTRLGQWAVVPQTTPLGNASCPYPAPKLGLGGVFWAVVVLKTHQITSFRTGYHPLPEPAGDTAMKMPPPCTRPCATPRCQRAWSTHTQRCSRRLRRRHYTRERDRGAPENACACVGEWGEWGNRRGERAHAPPFYEGDAGRRWQSGGSGTSDWETGHGAERGAAQPAFHECFGRCSA
jgi:hypothetical protein